VAIVADNGADLLAEVEDLLARFIVYPNSHALVAHVLWIVHTHCMERWDSTPRLVFEGPEKRCGKTRALEMTKLLVPHPELLANATAAYLVRKVSDPSGSPTILLDETDTIFGPRAKKDNEELRCILNAGYRRGATVGRCVPTDSGGWTTENLPAYCAVALAGIGNLPDTIRDRAVVIRMKRRLSNERVEPHRPARPDPKAAALCERLASWAKEIAARVMEARPLMPPGIEDRAADVWEALFAVADAAGGEWGERARAAARALVAEFQEEAPSEGVRLLADLRRIWVQRDDPPSMFTKDILEDLNALEEAPWAAWCGGQPLDSRDLANMLRPYGIRSTTVRIGSEVSKGYRRDDLWDAWERYTSGASGGARQSGAEHATDVTPVTDSNGKEAGVPPSS